MIIPYVWSPSLLATNASLLTLTGLLFTADLLSWIEFPDVSIVEENVGFLDFQEPVTPSDIAGMDNNCFVLSVIAYSREDDPAT